MAQDLWLQTDAGKNGGQFLINAENRKKPVVVEGNSLNIFLGAFKFDKVLDLSAYERVNLLIRDSRTEDDDNILVDTDVLAVDITAAITLSAWNAQAAYNAEWNVPAGEMAYDLGDEEEIELWMVLTAYNDTGGVEHVLGSGYVTMVEDANTGIAGGPQYMLKSVYDTNNNGKVDVAESAESVEWDDVQNKPATFPADLTGAVLYDQAQALSAGEKTQARDNIDAVDSTDVDAQIAARAVLYDGAQALDAGEEQQARDNIGAVSSSDVDTQIAGSAVLYDQAQALSGAEQQQARDNIGVESALAAGAVLYDQAQTLNAAEQQQARDNIGAIDSSDLTGAVLYDQSQALTSDEKTQARNNIGAAATSTEIEEMIIHHRKDLTKLEGATPECLQDVETAGITLTFPVVYAFLEASTGFFRLYELIEGDGTEVHSSPDVILPNDYNDPLNLRYFNLLSFSDLGSALQADGSVDGTARQQLGRLSYGAAEDVTVNEGSIAVGDNGLLRVDGAGDTADTLDTITGGVEGDMIMLVISDTGAPITIQHGTGANNIANPSGENVTLSALYQGALLWHNGTLWIMIADGQATGGGGSGSGSFEFLDQVVERITADATGLSNVATAGLTVLEDIRSYRDDDYGLLHYQLRTKVLTPKTISSVDTGASRITFGAAHNLNEEEQVRFFTDDTLPAPLVTGERYFAKVITSTIIEVSTVKGGSSVNITDTGTGSHHAYAAKEPFEVIPNDYSGSNQKVWQILRADARSRVVMQKQFYGPNEDVQTGILDWTNLPENFFIDSVFAHTIDQQAGGDVALQVRFDGSNIFHTALVIDQAGSGNTQWGEVNRDYEFLAVAWPEAAKGTEVSINVTDAGVGSTAVQGLIVSLIGHFDALDFD